MVLHEWSDFLLVSCYLLLMNCAVKDDVVWRLLCGDCEFTKMGRIGLRLQWSILNFVPLKIVKPLSLVCLGLLALVCVKCA